MQANHNSFFVFLCRVWVVELTQYFTSTHTNHRVQKITHNATVGRGEREGRGEYMCTVGLRKNWERFDYISISRLQYCYTTTLLWRNICTFIYCSHATSSNPPRPTCPIQPAMPPRSPHLATLTSLHWPHKTREFTDYLEEWLTHYDRSNFGSTKK